MKNEFYSEFLNDTFYGSHMKIFITISEFYGISY